jgi:hypothetical protein
MQVYLHAPENALLSDSYVFASLACAGFKNLPKTGEKNTLFGVYASECCGAEIVIRSGAAFPTCPEHPQMRTTWIPIEVGPDNLIELPKKKSKAEPAA